MQRRIKFPFSAICKDCGEPIFIPGAEEELCRRCSPKAVAVPRERADGKTLH